MTRGPEREDVSPHVTTGKKRIDFWYLIKIRSSNTRYEFAYSDDPADLGNLINHPYCGFLRYPRREENERLCRRERGGAVQCKTRVDKRRNHINKRIGGFKISLLDHNDVEVRKDFIDISFPARAGVVIAERG